MIKQFWPFCCRLNDFIWINSNHTLQFQTRHFKTWQTIWLKQIENRHFLKLFHLSALMSTSEFFSFLFQEFCSLYKFKNLHESFWETIPARDFLLHIKFWILSWANYLVSKNGCSKWWQFRWSHFIWQTITPSNTKATNLWRVMEKYCTERAWNQTFYTGIIRYLCTSFILFWF